MPWGLSLLPFCCKAWEVTWQWGRWLQVSLWLETKGSELAGLMAQKKPVGCRSCISWQVPSSTCISTGAVVASYFAANTVNSLPASWTLPLPYILVSWWGFKQYLTWRYYKANAQAIKGMFYNHGLTWLFSLAFDRKKKDLKIILKALWFEACRMSQHSIIVNPFSHVEREKFALE